jgi:hypothetical protein
MRFTAPAGLGSPETRPPRLGRRKGRLGALGNRFALTCSATAPRCGHSVSRLPDAVRPAPKHGCSRRRMDKRWQAVREGEAPPLVNLDRLSRDQAEAARRYPPGSIGAAFQVYIRTHSAQPSLKF